MYKSERMMKAIGDISDDKIEKTGRALGYQREQRRTSHVPLRMGRLLSIAAVVALFLALGVTAYAIYTHWSRGMEQRFPATDGEKELAEQSGLSDASQTVSATANGVTISVEQTIIDGDNAEIFPRNQQRQKTAGKSQGNGDHDDQRQPAWLGIAAGGTSRCRCGRDCAEECRNGNPPAVTECNHQLAVVQHWRQ